MTFSVTKNRNICFCEYTDLTRCLSNPIKLNPFCVVLGIPSWPSTELYIFSISGLQQIQKTNMKRRNTKPMFLWFCASCHRQDEVCSLAPCWLLIPDSEAWCTVHCQYIMHDFKGSQSCEGTADDQHRIVPHFSCHFTNTTTLGLLSACNWLSSHKSGGVRVENVCAS